MRQYLSDRTVLVDYIFQVDMVAETLYQLVFRDGLVAVFRHQHLQSPLELVDVDLLQRQRELIVSDEPCL